MRDKQFVAEHKGGLLSKENHRQLIRWACSCTEHVMGLKTDVRVNHALKVAEAWANGNTPTGDAIEASLEAHAAARETDNALQKAIARSAGQAVATAHMADHSLGAVLYALRAAEHAGVPVEDEWMWQQMQLQEMLPELANIIINNLEQKGLHKIIIAEAIKE